MAKKKIPILTETQLGAYVAGKVPANAFDNKSGFNRAFNMFMEDTIWGDYVQKHKLNLVLLRKYAWKIYQITRGAILEIANGI